MLKNNGFLFLLENNDKKLSLFIEYTNEENLELAKQDLALYGIFLGYRFNC